MKTIIFSLIVTCFLFAACSDNDGLIPVVNDGTETIAGEEQDSIPVSFHVDFTKEVIPLRASSSSEFSLNYLEYFVFDQDWNLCKSNKLVGSSGSFDDVFTIGTYTIIFIGYNSGTMSISNPYAFDDVPPSIYRIAVATGEALEDQFYARVNCSVNRNQVNNVAVTLERNVGKIEIVLDEVIPSEVTSINITPSLYFNTFQFSSSSASASDGGILGPPRGDQVQVIPISESDKLSKGFTISYLSYEPISSIVGEDVVLPITIESTYGQQVVSKTIPLSGIKKNKTRRYTGKLFEDVVAPSPFVLSIDDTWDGEPIEKPF